MTTPLFGIAELAASQAQKEETANEAFRILEALLLGRILDRDLTAPPGSPAESDLYLVAASPTGAWAGQGGKLALYLGGGWVFFTAKEGLTLYVADEDAHIVYDGSAWDALSGGGSSYTDEQARDAIGTALTAGNGVAVTVDDGADTITIARGATSINAQTGTTYTLVLSDAEKYITLSNAGTITLTVPPNSSVAFPVGTRIEIEQTGAGAVTVAAGSGVTVNSRGSDLTLAGQYAVAVLVKRATDTWTLTGDL